MWRKICFRGSRFHIRFETFWIDSDQKVFFDPNFLTLSFFHYFGHFGRKKQSPTKKFYTGKNFRFWDFCFKIRFNAFWIDSDQKIFRPLFGLCHFFIILVILAEKKNKVPRKNFTREKIFDFEIFVLKYVSRHPESIRTKKNFSTIIFWLCDFFTILAKKWLSPRKNFVVGKIFDFEIFVLRYISKHSQSIPTKKMFD